MQKLTTKEPTADMAEVAIAAVEAVFDWREYLKEEFGWKPEENEEKNAEHIKMFWKMESSFWKLPQSKKPG